MDGFLVLDNFADIDGTTLPNHTPDVDEVGSGWTDVIAGITIESNRASDNQGDRRAVIDSGAADVVMVCNMVISDNGQGFIFRFQDSTHFFIAITNALSNASQVWINNAGFSNIASFAHVWNSGDAVEIRLTLSGDSIKVEYDDVEEIDIINSNFQTETEHGLYQDVSSPSVDGTWDAFSIRAS